MSQHGHDDLQARFATQMRRAFFDKLRDDLAAEKPEAIDWLISLHSELGQRVAALRPGRADEIADKMDNELFARKIRAKAFYSTDMQGLVGFTYEILREVVAPDMDDALESEFRTVQAEMSVLHPVFSQVVPVFLRGVHGLLDETIERVRHLQQQATHPSTPGVE